MLKQVLDMNSRMLLHSQRLILDTTQLNRVVITNGKCVNVVLLSPGQGPCKSRLHVVMLHEHHKLLAVVVIIVGVGCELLLL